MKNIGEEIKKIRLELNISQAELARRCGVTAGAMCFIENGKRDLSLSLLRRVCKELNIKMSCLIAKVEDQ